MSKSKRILWILNRSYIALFADDWKGARKICRLCINSHFLVHLIFMCVWSDFHPGIFSHTHALNTARNKKAKESLWIKSIMISLAGFAKNTSSLSPENHLWFIRGIFSHGSTYQSSNIWSGSRSNPSIFVAKNSFFSYNCEQWTFNFGGGKNTQSALR